MKNYEVKFALACGAIYVRKRARRLADTCPNISLSDPPARHSLRALTPAALGQTSQSTRHSHSAGLLAQGR